MPDFLFFNSFPLFLSRSPLLFYILFSCNYTDRIRLPSTYARTVRPVIFHVAYIQLGLEDGGSGVTAIGWGRWGRC
jgi:hypothetical protein